MDKPKITAKDFFLWAGAMVALYWSVVAFIFLIFNYINYTFPNPLAYYSPDPYQSGISYEMASIIVLFPIYVLLMWMIRNEIVRDPSRKNVWIRRWAIILTLFVAGATIAIDLITVLTAFLNGESLTTAFLLKVVTVLLVAVGGFLHFMAELWGYWDSYPKRKRVVCTGVGILAAVAIVAGFFIVGTPAQARQHRFDGQRVSDLQSIQSEIISYWQAEGALPATLTDLNDSLSYWQMPLDPETNQSYTYKRTSPLDFQLCATFSASGDSMSIMPEPMGATDATTDNWQHTAGNVCFDRSIDPQRYPVQKQS